MNSSYGQYGKGAQVRLVRIPPFESKQKSWEPESVASVYEAMFREWKAARKEGREFTLSNSTGWTPLDWGARGAAADAIERMLDFTGAAAGKEKKKKPVPSIFSFDGKKPTTQRGGLLGPLLSSLTGGSDTYAMDTYDPNLAYTYASQPIGGDQMQFGTSGVDGGPTLTQWLMTAGIAALVLGGGYYGYKRYKGRKKTKGRKK